MAFKKGAVFNGRASRAEYWYFFLFNFIIIIALNIIDAFIGITKNGIGILTGIYYLVVLIPYIAVSIRRLHDTNHSGWWLLISLIPIVSIVLLIFLCCDSQLGENRYGPNPQKITTQNLKQTKQSYTDIKIEMGEKYIPILKMTMGIPHFEAKKTFNDLYYQVVEDSKKEGTINLPANYGDELLSKKNSDEKIQNGLGKRRKEGVTDKDIKWWWNIHDYERRLMLKVDEMSRVALFINEVRNSKADSNEKAFDEASKKVRRFFPMYGDPDDTTHTKGDDSPLPYELKDRINIYTEKRAKKDPDEYKKEIENSSTFNSLIRREIKTGNI